MKHELFTQYQYVDDVYEVMNAARSNDGPGKILLHFTAVNQPELEY